MDEIIRIAIDGPAGAGKSTVAKSIANRLGIDYVDTGAMYRALGLKILCTGIDMHDPEDLRRLLETTEIDYAAGHTYLDGTDVSGLIRLPAISKMASDCSAIGEVRTHLVAVQQALGHRKSIIMDGRDICFAVLPDAQYKFYLTASSDVRAMRRVKELEEKGEPCNFEEIKASIEYRDYQDSHRECSPLIKTEDAVEIDSSNMNLEETIDKFLSYIK